MTAIKVAAFVVAWLVFVFCSIAGLVKTQKMVSEVNSRLPEEERFSPLGWYPYKYQRLLREYRHLNPQGKLIDELRILGFATLPFPVVGAVLLGFGIGVALFFGVGFGVLLWLTYKP